MTPQQAILSLGFLTLTGCGAGMVLIHDSNPLLKGLNWMGGALVVGGVSAGMTMGAGTFPWLEPLANFCILLALVCCFRADQLLIGTETGRARVSAWLIGCEAAAGVLQESHLIHAREAIIVLSVLATTQLAVTARLIQRSAIAKGRMAGRYTAGIMGFLAIANLLRGGCAAAGLLPVSRVAESLDQATYTVFIAAAIGLGFAFFWRTTAKLSMELEHMASTDPLTRVYNRRVFLHWCESEQSRSQRMSVSFSVLMLDFDHFKKVNDTYGHHVGDKVLCAAVERIQDAIRGIDVLCRWGGEEFAVLLPNASAEATHLVAERVRRNVPLLKSADAQFTDEAFAGLQLSASIGTATYSGPEDTFHSMLQRADAALYEAKRNGRNRVVMSSAPVETKVEVFPSQLLLETQ